MGSTGGGKIRKHRISGEGDSKLIDDDGYEMISRPWTKTIGQYMPQNFAVDAERL